MASTRQTWRRMLPPVQMHERTALGIAIRRHWIDIVVGDDAAALQTQVSLPHSRRDDDTPAIPHLLHAIRALLAEQNIAADALLGIGIGLPTFQSGGQLPAGKTTRWDGEHLGQSLCAEFGVPTYFDSDTNMGTLGESRYGVGHAVRDMLYVAIGTDITAGIMMNGQIYRSGAGAIGHMAIDPRGAQCHCGQRGCLETRAGAAAIITMAQSQGSAVTTMEQVIDAAQHGDVGSRVALEQAGAALGTALANAVVMLNPAMIVLGGATMRAGDLLLAPLRQTIMQHHRIACNGSVQIMPGTLGSKAAVLGGMATVLDDCSEL